MKFVTRYKTLTDFLPTHLDKVVGDEMLVLQLDLGVVDQLGDGLVVDQDVALARRTGDGLTGALVHDLGRQVLGPAGRAVDVAALQPGHHLEIWNAS